MWAVITSWSSKARRLVGMFMFAVKIWTSNQSVKGHGLKVGGGQTEAFFSTGYSQ